MKNSQRGIAPLIVALVVAVVLGGGYLIWSKNSNDFSAPSVTINQDSLTATSAFPAITGTATNISSVGVDINGSVPNDGSDGNGMLALYAGTVPVVNGAWSFTPSQSNEAHGGPQGLSVGTYTVIVGQTKSSPLVTGILNVASITSAQQVASWKTYTNSQLGFSFQYPADLVSNLSSNGVWVDVPINLNAPEPIRLNISGSVTSAQDEKTCMPESYLKGESGRTSSVPVQVGPVLFSKYLFDGDPGMGMVDFITTYTTWHANTCYEIRSTYDKANNATQSNQKVIVLTDQMLSTFKFISLVSATSDWKTYTDVDHGFSIQYPDGTKIQNMDGNGTFGVSLQVSDSQSLYVTVSFSVLGQYQSNKCNEDLNPNVATSSVTIDGVDFIKGDASEAATAQRSSTTEYCALKSGVAYKIRPTIEYSRDDNTANGFNPAVNVNNDSILNQMVSTFKFVSPSTTTTH